MNDSKSEKKKSLPERKREEENSKFHPSFRGFLNTDAATLKNKCSQSMLKKKLRKNKEETSTIPATIIYF